MTGGVKHGVILLRFVGIYKEKGETENQGMSIDKGWLLALARIVEQ